MGEKPGRHRGHVRLGAACDVGEIGDVLGVRVKLKRADELLKRGLACSIDVVSVP